VKFFSSPLQKKSFLILHKIQNATMIAKILFLHLPQRGRGIQVTSRDKWRAKVNPQIISE